MNKKTTIKDIAKKANVSIATVSRVLRRTDYPVSQDVKKRVFDAADELEYKPNMFSRMLRGDTSIEIGIIVPSINNPFYLIFPFINFILSSNIRSTRAFSIPANGRMPRKTDSCTYGYAYPPTNALRVRLNTATLTKMAKLKPGLVRVVLRQ